jgi:hypothetical protein
MMEENRGIRLECLKLAVETYGVDFVNLKPGIETELFYQSVFDAADKYTNYIYQMHGKSNED